MSTPQRRSQRGNTRKSVWKKKSKQQGEDTTVSPVVPRSPERNVTQDGGSVSHKEKGSGTSLHRAASDQRDGTHSPIETRLQEQIMAMQAMHTEQMKAMQVTQMQLLQTLQETMKRYDARFETKEAAQDVQQRLEEDKEGTVPMEVQKKPSLQETTANSMYLKLKTMPTDAQLSLLVNISKGKTTHPFNSNLRLESVTSVNSIPKGKFIGFVEWYGYFIEHVNQLGLGELFQTIFNEKGCLKDTSTRPCTDAAEPEYMNEVYTAVEHFVRTKAKPHLQICSEFGLEPIVYKDLVTAIDNMIFDELQNAVQPTLFANLRNRQSGKIDNFITERNGLKFLTQLWDMVGYPQSHQHFHTHMLNTFSASYKRDGISAAHAFEDAVSDAQKLVHLGVDATQVQTTFLEKVTRSPQVILDANQRVRASELMTEYGCIGNDLIWIDGKHPWDLQCVRKVTQMLYQHEAAQNIASPLRTVASPNKKECTYCKSHSNRLYRKYAHTHDVQDCGRKRKMEGQKSSAPQSNGEQRRAGNGTVHATCYNCQEKGHYKSQCPKLTAQQGEKLTPSKLTSALRKLNTSEQKELVNEFVQFMDSKDSKPITRSE